MKSVAYTVPGGGGFRITNHAARIIIKNTTAIIGGSDAQVVAVTDIVVFGWAA